MTALILSVAALVVLVPVVAIDWTLRGEGRATSRQRNASAGVVTLPLPTLKHRRFHDSASGTTRCGARTAAFPPHWPCRAGASWAAAGPLRPKIPSPYLARHPGRPGVTPTAAGITTRWPV
jgi:hypothetical protein